MTTPENPTRRRLLRLAGVTATVAVAGCGGGNGDGGDGNGDGGDDTVPDQYRTATSQGGQERDPDGLSSKDALNYQDSPNDGDQCSGCTFYITDMNGDGMGACTLVEGNIDPEGWCASFSEFEG